MIRKGVTLIELIFTVVIIATVFTVVPKIIFAINKSDSLSMRQDALMNGVSMLHMVSNMPWDKNDVNSSDILHTSNFNFECNSTTYYRIGGFIGSRRCEDNLSSTAINMILHDRDDTYTLEDIGDFNNTDINVSARDERLYELNISVSYVDDGNMVFRYKNNSLNIDLNKSKYSIVSTNLKRVDIKVYYSGKRGTRRELAQFNYVSANIGLLEINKREW